MRKDIYTIGLVIGLLVLLVLIILFGPFPLIQYNIDGTPILIGFPLLLIFLFDLFLLIVSWIGRRKGRWGGVPPFFWYYRSGWDEDAFEILDERYARGEITKEQYDQMAEDLRRRRERDDLRP